LGELTVARLVATLVGKTDCSMAESWVGLSVEWMVAPSVANLVDGLAEKLAGMKVPQKAET
jgi:hypothetical protein